MKAKRAKPAKKKIQVFLAGVSCGAKVSSELMKTGWKDLGKLEAEVLRRVQGKR